MTESHDIMAAADRSMDLAVRYGVNETNPIWASEATHENVDFDRVVHLGSKGLKRIVRLRLLTEPGYPYMDISYVYGQMEDGGYVRLHGAPMSISKFRPKADLIAWAREERVNAKRLGLLDEGCWSILR